jgi:imidazolonepropionase-like amidohydrolase
LFDSYRYEATDNPYYADVSEGLLAQWQTKADPRTAFGPLTPEQIQEGQRVKDGEATFVRLAYRRGIKLLSGTDTTMPGIAPGVSLHRELVHLVEDIGMTPVEAIQISTQNAAAALKLPYDGTIKQGAPANIAVFSGDVSTNIGALSSISKVIVNGHIYDAKVLQGEAEELAKLDVDHDDGS